MILHEGLNPNNKVKFTEKDYGNARKGNIKRYEAITEAYKAQGAKMEDVNAATEGQVKQRKEQKGYNDAVWDIVEGNYDRFITQIEPKGTSIGLWRVCGEIDKDAHRFYRFSRGFKNSTVWNTMHFEINDRLLPNPKQIGRIKVTYFDGATGSFRLSYDAEKGSEELAISVSKSNSGK